MGMAGQCERLSSGLAAASLISLKLAGARQLASMFVGMPEPSAGEAGLSAL
jgi:hypothetical protein